MTLYAELLGDSLAQLAEPLCTIHNHRGTAIYRGEVEVHRGKNLLARLCASVAKLPASYAGAIEVEIVAAERVERWTRRFGAHVMRSRLHAHEGYLRERLGPVRFDFALETHEGAIRWRVARVRILGLPLPAAWFAGVRAVESVQNGLYVFDVRADLPGIGLIVHYAGRFAVC